MPIVFLLLFLLISSAYAQEDIAKQAEPAEQEQGTSMKTVPAFNPESLGIPIYPNSKEISGDTVKQGSFEATSFVFMAPVGFETALKYYKRNLAKDAEVREVAAPGGRRAHFFINLKEESRNVILEEAGKDATRIVIAVFAGGGGRTDE